MVVLLLALASACLASTLPVVDLGYERHQALSYNGTSGLYKFNNIRYAAPPIGDLRFRAPAAPEVNRMEIQNGSVARVCPQAAPVWDQVQATFVVDYLYGLPFDGSSNTSDYTYTPIAPDPSVSEDCLFLDIIVPKKVFDQTKVKKATRKNLAPVLVWIYGGGYITGDKTLNDARGLAQRSTVAGHDGIVYVSINYRLGAFGWLGGDSVTANGTANAALHDQRFALNWVKKNIHLFGGDSSRVTVMGESAGGGSVLHQVTAYGGQGTVPFQQAIIQSPGWIPLVTEEVQEATLQQFLGFLNVSTIEEARTLSSDKLIAANSAQIAIKSQWGQFTYGPTVDGTFAPALPGQLLLEGKFHSGVNVMVGHTADEGLLFTSPESYNSTGFASELATLIPNSPKNKFDYIVDVLYPAVYNGSYDYKDSVARSALMVSDLGFQCNTDYINHAFEKTYAYEFVISPGLHGQDGSYTFYNPGETVVSSNPDVVTAMSSVTNVSVALAMQDYFLSFTENGVPTSSLAPPIESRGSSGQLMSINTHTIQRAQDATNNHRCKFWQTASDLFQ